MDYVAEVFQEVTSHYLEGLGSYTGWIRAGGYYHWKVKQLEQLRYCPHLRGSPVPEGPLVRPSSRQQPQQSCRPDQPSATTTSASRQSQGEGPTTSEELIEPPQVEVGAGDSQSWYARTVKEEALREGH